jgi:beta-propeller repeat-containing protein
MKGRFAFATFVLLTIVALSTFTLRATDQVGHSPIASPSPARRQTVFSRLPLRFEANAGQTDPHVEFLARGPGYSLFLARSEAILSLSKPSRAPRPAAAPGLPSEPSFVRSAVLRMTLVGAKKSPQAIGIDRLPGVSNYATGGDRSKWLTGVPSYARVRYKSVYAGIDVEYYGKQTQLEYDFVVEPGADPSLIRLAFHGADRLVLNNAGELVLEVDGAEVRQARPVLYQEIDGVRLLISGGYRLLGTNVVGFEIGAYDRTRPMIIDPVLIYSTYLGGSGNDGSGDIGLDSSNNIYVVGNTNSPNFPVSGGAVGIDVFVTKLNPAGDAIVYSTFLGGTNNDGDAALALAVDSAGNAYVTGNTNSANFPATLGASDETCGSDGNCNSTGDAFVTKLNAAGALVYSTYVGGSDSDAGYAIAVNSLGEAFISGGTADTSFNGSNDFPIVGGYQSGRASFYDSFVARLNASGTAILYSTILAGSNDDYAGLDIVAVGSVVYVTGVTRSLDFPTTAGAYDTACGTSYTQHDGTFDAFVTILNTAAAGPASLIYGTCLGAASGDESGNGMVVDAVGYVHVTGHTSSADFPTVNAVQSTHGGGLDAFVTTINPTAAGVAQVIYSTFLGGSGHDIGRDIKLDSDGGLVVAGYTASLDFPDEDPIHPANGGSCGVNPDSYPCNDAFVAKLFPDGSPLVFSTYAGGSGDDYGWRIALDSVGTVHLTGSASSIDFPTKNPLQAANAGGIDAFVIKLVENDRDGDLIHYNVDEAPLVASNRFSDRPLGGRTSGRIAVVPAGMTVQIVDHPNPARGVRATVAGAAGQRATLRLDGKGSSILLRSPGTYTVTDPNTETTVGVDVGGPAELSVVVNGSTFIVEIGAGEEAKITETDNDGNGTVDSVDVESIVGQITVNGVPIAPGGLTVGSLLNTKLAIQQRLRTFELATTLVASGPIDPRVEPVGIRVGAFATTIPPAFFVLKRGVYSYAGTIAGVRLIASITPQRSGRYAVTVLGSGPNFTGVVNPVPVQITIGDDSGIQSVRATIW